MTRLQAPQHLSHQELEKALQTPSLDIPPLGQGEGRSLQPQETHTPPSHCSRF